MLWIYYTGIDIYSSYLLGILPAWLSPCYFCVGPSVSMSLLSCCPFCLYVSTVSLARCGGPAWLTLAYMRDVSKREEKEGFNNYFHIDGLQ